MKPKSKLNKLILGMALVMGCYISKENVMASMTEAYKNQRLNGKHVGAYVPPSEYQIPSGFNTPKGITISSSSGSIEVQLQNASAALTIPDSKLIMYKDTKDSTKMATNTSNLQYVIDEVSNAGGGVVKVAAGNYYFSTGGVISNNHYVIFAKDNVTVAGTLGNDGDLLTTFLPVGAEANGITMFEYTQADWNNIKYLTNADYRDFKIDGINATHNAPQFYAQGKGFAFAIVKDCDWYNVEVQNTNGTGFGMDELLNSTVTNCSANACGNYYYKDSNGVEHYPGDSNGTNDVGASGFGIGYGYSTNESISITYCIATNNRRFGIFFESQARFSNAQLNKTVVNKLEANYNICAGNRYNMGGEYCFNSLYKNNISKRYSDEYDYPNPMNIINNNVQYYFGKQQGIESKNNTVTLFDGTSLKMPAYPEYEKYEDSVCTHWNFDPVRFVTAANYMDAKSSTVFGAIDKATRSESVEVLYRLCGRPTVSYKSLYNDVKSNTKYVNAIMWANEKEIAKGYQNESNNFGVDDIISRHDICIMFYRYAKLIDPNIKTAGDLSQYPDGASFTQKEEREAFAWCLEAGIISPKAEENSTTGEKKLLPAEPLYRQELAAMVYKLVNFFEKTKIKLSTISFSNAPTTMTVGDNSTISINYNPTNTTDSKDYTLSSSNSNVITINGIKITAKAAGKATITATCNGKTTSKEITVLAAQEFLKGDVTKDNFVNSTDASMVLDLFKNNNATQEDFKRGDMDDNNILNAKDASLILDLFKNS